MIGYFVTYLHICLIGNVKMLLQLIKSNFVEYPPVQILEHNCNDTDDDDDVGCDDMDEEGCVD